jgi:hypothetical protein
MKCQKFQLKKSNKYSCFLGCNAVYTFTDISEVLAVSIVRSMGPDYEGSKHLFKSVDFYQTTRRNNSKDSHFHTRRLEYLKSALICKARASTG